MNEFIEKWYNETAKDFESPSEGSLFLEQLNELFEAQQWEEVTTLLTTLPKKINIKDLTEYMKVISQTVAYDKSKHKVKIGSTMIHALLSKFDDDKIFTLNRKYTFETACGIAEELREKKGGTTLAFVITNNIKLEGKVMSERSFTKQAIDLVKYYEPSERNRAPFTVYFGAGAPKSKPVKNLTEYYFAYDFESGNKQYLLLSKEQIRGNKLKLEGMMVKCSDKVKAGGTFHLPSNVEVVFVTKWENNRHIKTVEEIKEVFVNKTHDEQVARWLGKFRHPKIFEQLILVFLYSGVYDGYPLHLGIIGPPGSGKTKGLQRPLNCALPDVYLESDSTFKHYIPSYGGGTPSQGALLRSERICYGDEFLSSLVTSGHTAEYGNMFGKLTGILEWSKHEAGSGYGVGFSRIEPTMQLLATTNFQAGLSNLGEAANKLNNATMSRIFWLVQTPNHIDFIKERASEIMSYEEDERNPAEQPENYWLYDWCKSNKSNIDYEKVKEIYKNYEPMIPFNMHDVYLRYDHHIYCIIDGVSKYRWFLGEKPSYEVPDEQDYLLARKLFQYVLTTWIDSIDFTTMTKKNVLGNVTNEARVIYEYVCSNLGLSREKLFKKFGEGDSAVASLVFKELVKEVDGCFYPDWHYKFKEVEVQEVEMNEV